MRAKYSLFERMLHARHSTTLAVEIRRKRRDHRVEDGNRRDLQPPAALLQQLAQRVANEREQDDPRIGLDAGDHPFDLPAGADHGPHMFDGLHILELYETGSGNRVNGLSGRIGNEVEVKPGHADRPAADRTINAAMWTASSSSTAMPNKRRSVTSCPRVACSLNRMLNRTGEVDRTREYRGRSRGVGLVIHVFQRVPRLASPASTTSIPKLVHISTDRSRGSLDRCGSRGSTNNPRYQPPSSIYHLLREHLQAVGQALL